MLNILLKDIARGEGLTIQSSESLKRLIDVMNENQKGVVVVLKDQRPVGIMTERDIVEILYKGGSLDIRVDTYIGKSLVCTSGRRTVGYALNLTLENKIRRVIVVDDEQNFIGVVTHQDLLEYLEEDFYRLTIKIRHIVKNAGDLISISREETLHDVLKLMFTNKISSVPVLEGRKPVGIISEKDILALANMDVPLDSRVGKYMNSPVDTAVLDSLLVEVVEVMNYKKIRRIVIIDDEGAAISMVTIRDVIANLEGNYNKFMERKLQSAKEILNFLPEILIEVTDTGREQLIIWINEKAVNKFGRSILDKPVTDLLPRETWNGIHSTLTRFNKIEQIKFKIEESIYELSGFFISTFGKTEKGRFQLIIRDITEDIKLSTVDPLTDIYNRRFINGFLMKEIERSKRFDGHFSVVITDVDGFKGVNDSFGHPSGDMVLKALAGEMTGELRSMDIVGRYGGDEFMFILPDTDSATAANVMERLREKVENLELPVLNDSTVRITASFGVASYPEDGTSLDDLLIIADERLYHAKGSGKNRVVCV